MAHQLHKSSISLLVERLNRFPQGAPPSELLNKILKILFSEQEAALVALLPIKPFTAKKAASVWKMDLAQTQKLLEALAGRALLVDVEQNGQSVYSLPIRKHSVNCFTSILMWKKTLSATCLPMARPSWAGPLCMNRF